MKLPVLFKDEVAKCGLVLADAAVMACFLGSELVIDWLWSLFGPDGPSVFAQVGLVFGVVMTYCLLIGYVAQRVVGMLKDIAELRNNFRKYFRSDDDEAGGISGNSPPEPEPVFGPIGGEKPAEPSDEEELAGQGIGVSRGAVLRAAALAVGLLADSSTQDYNSTGL